MKKNTMPTYRRNVRLGLWRYDDKWDAYYETKTRKWIEPKCSDPKCDYCGKRPPLAPKIRRTPYRGA